MNRSEATKRSRDRKDRKQDGKCTNPQPQFPGIASVHVSNHRYDEKCCKELLKAVSNSSSVNCALHAEAIVDGLGKNYANLQAVVKMCQLFISELSTVIDSSNQILIPGAGIWNGGINGMSTGFPAHFLLTRPLLARPARPRLH